jgi:hypothetical protein
LSSKIISKKKSIRWPGENHFNWRKHSF